MTEVIDHFMNLFRGRGDVRWNWATKRAEYGPVTKVHFERHLTSADPNDWLGAYPLLGHLCSWGAVDIDHTDDPTIAVNLKAALAYKDVPAWVERTDHGFHVWCFPENPPGLVEAETMRGALYAACAAIGYEPREVNPKQPQAKKVGNLVRVPYNGALARENPYVTRRLWDEQRNPLPAYDLQYVDQKGRAPVHALEAIAKLWTPPERSNAELGEALPISKTITDKMSGRTFTIFRDGPINGADRSGTMLRLAAACAGDGMEPAEIKSALHACHFNKYRDRDDEDLILDDLVGRVT